MSKKLLSFLGTNAYLHTIYEFDGKKSKPVRYIQEALAELICRDWQYKDEVIIFATSGKNGSIEKNWEQGQINKFDEKGKNLESNPKGLKDRLESLNLDCKIKMIEIPDGTKDGEIWQIIQKVYENINNEDKIYFDITHSFRYIPMIIPSIVSFLKTTKNINLKSIHYGVFEVLGSPQDIIKMDIEERIAPVRELSELYEMIEWSVATNAFLLFGNGEYLIKQIDRLNNKPLDNKIKSSLPALKRNISNIDTALKYNDIKNLKSENIKIEKKVNLKENPELFALKNIAPKIENYLQKWGDNEVINGISAAKWHLQYDRFAQALTFTHEALVTYFCKLFNWDETNKDYRGAVDFTVQVKLQQENKNQFNKDNLKKWYLSVVDDALAKLDKFDKSFLKDFISIRNWRNTINHTKQGDRKNMKEKFPEILEKIDSCL